jgi:hypothetical protein
MKKIISIIILLLISSISFSQDLEIKKINDIKYVFNHTINYDISHYEDRLKLQFESINKIKITNQKVEIIFKENLSEIEISNILLEVSKIFNYQKYILI